MFHLTDKTRFKPCQTLASLLANGFGAGPLNFHSYNLSGDYICLGLCVPTVLFFFLLLFTVNSSSDGPAAIKLHIAQNQQEHKLYLSPSTPNTAPSSQTI